MNVKAKYIRTPKRVIDAAQGESKVRLAYKIDSKFQDSVKRIGLDSLVLNSGAVPSAIGKKTLANSEGFEIVRDDLPKVDRTYSVYRTWRDWHDNEHSGYQDITRKAYPRESFLPSLHKLYLIQIEGSFYISSDVLDLTSVSDDVIVSVANILLECFGSFDVIGVDKIIIDNSNIQTLSWELLPKGENPWSRSLMGLKLGSRPLNTDRKIAIEHRYKTMTKLKPDSIYRGCFAFNGYYVFEFKSKKTYVLESIYLNNATYVFNENWEVLSRLTKSQIINGDVPHQRIIHDSKWSASIGKLLA